MSRWSLLPPMAIAAICSTLATAEPQGPVVAVLDVESQGMKLDGDLRERLTTYLTVRVAETRRSFVVPREKVKGRLVWRKRDPSCRSQSCQIDLGDAVAADKTLVTQVIKLGSQCKVGLTLFDLARAATEDSATASGPCSEEGIAAALEAAFEKLAGGPVSAIGAAATNEGGLTSQTATPGIEWVPIPGGKFLMGSDTSREVSEEPTHRVAIKAFRMTRTETTVDQYRACVRAGACGERELTTCGGWTNWDGRDRGNHPVNCVDWSQAREFCRWAGGRLPTEAEWEYAARSAGRGQEYPWGDEVATCSRAVLADEENWGCGEVRTWAVCSKPAGHSEQGLCDLAGNVWEWVQDVEHDDYRGAPGDGSAWEDDRPSRVVRGGGKDSVGWALRATNRLGLDPTKRRSDIGFRCARSD